MERLTVTTVATVLSSPPVSMTQEAVVLVDEENRVLGTMPKVDVHQERTPLHRGFSCFVFRAGDKRLLIQ